MSTPQDRLAAFGARIAARRTDVGLTQQQLAAAVGIGRSSIANLERGDQATNLETLVALANVLGATVDELLGRACPESKSVWVAMASRITSDEAAHRRSAAKNWDVHAYAEAIRERALADGLALAREVMLHVIAESRSSEVEQ